MQFPSWHELTEKISEFEKSVDAAIGKKVQGFQDKHPLGDKAVKTIITILPPPFDAIAENIYNTSEGSDEAKFEKIKEYLDTIQKQGEEHYNKLSAKSDIIIQEVLNLQDITAKESTIQLVKNLVIAQSDTFNQQLEQIKESLIKMKTQIGGDQIGYWVRGSNNIIGKNISVINQEIKPTGLTMLEPDYFEHRKNVKDDFENWKKGYAFELSSIYYGYEFKRETMTDEIKQKLEASYKLLLLGESGTSKSTIMMQIMCDYFRKRYTVLHNIGSTQLAQANDIVQYIEGLVKGKNKLLIAIDNAHDKKMSAIFYVIDQLSFIDNSEDLLFVATARLPEYDTLVSKRLLEMDDQDRIALKKFNETPNIKYPIPYFKNAEEVEQFFTFYKTKFNVEKSAPKSYLDIFNETGGHPIMVKFFLLGKGLRQDVENRYKFYLFDSETKKPIGENIQTMLICALFSISNYTITDKTLDNMKLRKHAKSIIGILHRRKDGTWTTIHSRWDMELFSYLFSSEDEDEIEDRKTQLSDACTSIFDMRNKQFSSSVISALYDMAGESRIPINIVNDNVRIPDYIANDKDAMYSMHAYDKCFAYRDLKMYDEMLFECDEAIKLIENGVDALNNKGVALGSLGKYAEAIEWYDKALKIDPNYVLALYGKGLALDNLGKYQEAIEEYDKVLNIEPNYAYGFGLYSKGIALSNLGKYAEAIDWYDKALKIDPDDVLALNSKGVALSNLGKYAEAIDWYDKALKIDPDDVLALSSKGVALGILGKYQEAIEWYDKALKIDPNNVYVLYNKGVALGNLSKYKEAIDCYDKVLEKDQNYVDALNNKGVALRKIGKYQKAIEWYDKALAIDPNDVNALNNKGSTLDNLGKYQEAIEWYDKALKIDPNNVYVLYNKGVALGNLSKYKEAIEEYDKVLKINPNDVNSLDNKGSTLDNLGKYQEAIEWYDKALAIDPNDVNALNNKGSALGNLSKYKEAMDCYDKVLEINPNDVDALNNKGSALGNLSKYKEAMEWYDKAFKIDPMFANTLDNKGYVLFRLNKINEAIQYSDKAIELDASYANAWYNRSCYMVKKGDIEEALKDLQEAIKLNSSYHESAKTDKDFDPIRNDERFKKLIL